MIRASLVVLAFCVSSFFVCSGQSLEHSDLSNCSPTPSTCAATLGARAELPFRFYAGYLVVVEGRIGTLKKLRFVLDTGVTHSVVDRKTADRLHVHRGPAEVLNFDKAVAVERGKFPDLQFGPVEVRDIPLLVADLAYFSEFTEHVDALIGMDLLRLNNLTIDNNAKKVFFDPLDRAAYEAAAKTAPVCITAEVVLQNHPVRLIVDTGLQGMLLYEERVLERIPELMMASKTKVEIGRRQPAKQLTIANARLGVNEIDPRVWLVKSPPENVLPAIDGFLGTSALKAKWIKFNFASNTLSWQ